LDPGILLTERDRQDLRAERRTAHSHKQDIRKAGLVDIALQFVIFCGVRRLFLADRKPAEPFRFVVAGPYRSILGPDSVHLVTVVPFCDAVAHGVFDL